MYWGDNSNNSNSNWPFELLCCISTTAGLQQPEEAGAVPGLAVTNSNSISGETNTIQQTPALVLPRFFVTAQLV
jgi:hypothetical protein